MLMTMLMMSSRTPHVSGGTSIGRIMTTSIALLLLSLSCVVSPVTSFLLPRQQQSLQQQHQPPIVLPSPSPLPITSEDGRRSLLYQSPQSQDGNAATTAATGTSKRAQRKAAQRAKKQLQQTQTSNNINKVTSQHPEAIIKRQKQQQGGNNNNTNSKRRNHNFAQRAEYLSEGTDEQFGFNDNLDQLTLTTIPKTQGDTTIDDKATNNNIQFHQLHSQRVSKLDEKTTADDVVKAIKRAQNLHDEHDVVEIAHFLLEEVGELVLCVHN